MRMLKKLYMSHPHIPQEMLADPDICHGSYRLYALYAIHGIYPADQCANALRTTPEIIRQYNGELIDNGYLPLPHYRHWPNAGIVYLLRGGGYCKIGLSKDADRRVAQISPRLPFPVDFVHVIKTNDRFWLEAHLHELFKNKRTNGEWFALSEKAIRWLMICVEWNRSPYPEIMGDICKEEGEPFDIREYEKEPAGRLERNLM